jgi:hypothetical protein
VSDKDKQYGAPAVGSNGRKKRKGERGVEHQQPLKRGGHGGWPCGEEMEGGGVRRGGHWSVIGVGVSSAVCCGGGCSNGGDGWRMAHTVMPHKEETGEGTRVDRWAPPASAPGERVP